MITGPSETIKRARKLRSEMTLPEGILWRALRLRPEGLKFRRQHPAGSYILDFYCAAARLAIVDGCVHDTIRASRSDAVRGHFLRSQGIATLRVPTKIVLDDLRWWPGSSRFARSAWGEVARNAACPSTMLRMVPLPVSGRNEVGCAITS